MSKAEDRVYEFFPNEAIESKKARFGFLLGYHQAEKDLALTWEDIEQICDIAFEEACRLQRNMKASLIYKKQHYQEVLKRFLKERKDESNAL